MDWKRIDKKGVEREARKPKRRVWNASASIICRERVSNTASGRYGGQSYLVCLVVIYCGHLPYLKSWTPQPDGCDLMPQALTALAGKSATVPSSDRRNGG